MDCLGPIHFFEALRIALKILRTKQIRHRNLFLCGKSNPFKSCRTGLYQSHCDGANGGETWHPCGAMEVNEVLNLLRAQQAWGICTCYCGGE